MPAAAPFHRDTGEEKMSEIGFQPVRRVLWRIGLLALCVSFTGPASAAVGPTQDFGTVALGSSADRTVGEFVPFGIVGISRVFITGANATEFQVIGDSCSGSTLRAGEFCLITVRFTPASTDPKSAQLIVESNLGQDTFALLGNQTQIEITPNAPADSKYPLLQLPAMPFVSATAKIVGIPNAEQLTKSTTFTWRTEIRYTPPKGKASDFEVNLRETRIVGGQNPYNPDFLGQVRGGNLTLIVTATINGIVFEKTTKGLQIVGQNPLQADLCVALQNNTARRIAAQESGQKQFIDGLPYWSRDGGAGIMQITPPTPDQVWNWRSNVQAGLSKLYGGLALAGRYPSSVERSKAFRALVDTYNQVRRAGQPKVQVTVPAFTTSGFDASPAALGESELVAIRAYNGASGSDGFGNGLQEFRIAVDRVNGVSILRLVDLGNNKAKTIWERVPASDRPASPGDPDYVNHVLGQGTGCAP
jgi:hypothetical protein